jgi:hypothetical protein
MAVREGLQMQVTDSYRNEMFKLPPRWDNLIKVPGDYGKK